MYFQNYEKTRDREVDWLTNILRFVGKEEEEPEELPEGHYESDYWMLAIDKARFGNRKINSKVSKVILDTGCTLFQAPKDFIEQIIKFSGQ